MTYEGLELEIPIEGCIHITKFCLTEKKNEHARLELKIEAEEEKAEEAVLRLCEDASVKVLEKHRESGKKKAVFYGKIITASMLEEKGLCCLALCCVSYTYEWDLGKKSQSFCDLSETYEAVLHRVLSGYPKKDVLDHVTKGSKHTELLLQYEETDWSYLKRLASYFGTFLFVDPSVPFGRAHFGVPRLSYGITLEKEEYSMKKDMEQYYYYNTLEDFFPQETIKWEFTSTRRLYFGEEILFGKVQVQVTGVTMKSELGALVYSYEVSRLKGIRIPYQTNPQIFGMSLPATVKERQGNCIRVHLDIDANYEQKPGTKWFTYAIESSSFYCVPEEGSRVHIYFPSQEEKDAIAVHAIRTQQAGAKFADKAQDPDTKSFSNSTGSELQMTPSDLSVAADADKTICIKMDDAGNVSLTGTSITITADDTIQIGERESSHTEVPLVKPKQIEISCGGKISLTHEGNEEQGITLEEEAKIIAAFAFLCPSVKAPAEPGKDAFVRDPAADQAELGRINGEAKQALEAKKAEGLAKIRHGLASIAGVVGAGVLIAVTGGAAAPLVVAAVVSGTAVAACAAADIVEGVGDYGKSQSGDLSRSFHPIRDTLFQGNEEAYQLFKGVSEFVFGVVSSVAIGTNAGNSLGKLGKFGTFFNLCEKNVVLRTSIKVGIHVSNAIIQDWAADGKIDWENLGKTTLASIGSSLLGSYLQGTSLKLLGKYGGEFLNGLLNNPYGKKAVEAVAGTGFDTFSDWLTAHLSGQEFDLKESLGRNLLMNALVAVFGEPVDAVRGSYFVTAADFMLPGIADTFRIERRYTSTSKQSGLLGTGWAFSYDSRIYREGEGERIHLQTVPGYLVQFVKEGNRYVTRSRGCGRFTMEQPLLSEGFLLKDCVERKEYRYNTAGLLEEIEDQNGQKIQFFYQGEALERIVTDSGFVLEVSCEGGKLRQMTDPIGRTIKYRYTGEYLTEVIHVDHGVTRYTYDENGYLEKASDQNGVTYLVNRYDREGRVIRQELADGTYYTAEYDPGKRRNQSFDSRSQSTTVYEYGEGYEILAIRYADGTAEEYSYDANGFRTGTKNRRGFLTAAGYDAEGRLLEKTDACGLHTVYAYDRHGLLAKEEDNGGGQTLYSYDERGNRTEVRKKRSAGNWKIQTFAYDYRGRLLLETGGDYGTVSYAYEKESPSPSMRIDAFGNRTWYTYDAAGRRMKIENAYGTVEFGYNHLNQVTRIEDGEGGITRKLYDRMGLLVALYPPKSREENPKGYTYRYDAFGHCTEETSPPGACRKKSYDWEGHLLKEVHPNGYDSSTGDGPGASYEYDGFGNLIRIKQADGGTERRFYDGDGNLIKRVEPECYHAAEDDGIGYSYESDAAGRLVKVTAPDGSLESSYTYDLHGNLTSETNGLGYTSYFVCDLLGNRLEERVPVKEADGAWQYRLTRFGYDGNGDKILEERGKHLVTRTGYAAEYIRITYQYDACRRLARVTDGTGGELRYRYDCLNQRIYEEWKRSDTVSERIYYKYDRAGRLIEKKTELDAALAKALGQTFAVTRYVYDLNGNRVKEIRPDGTEYRLTYDLADRCIREEAVDNRHGIHRVTEYTYDAADNVTKAVQYGLGENEAGAGTESVWSYGYNWRDQAEKVRNPFGGTKRYYYNKNGQLIKAVRPENYDPIRDDGPGERYGYDLNGRIREARRESGARSGWEYDPAGQLSLEINATGQKKSYRYQADGMLTGVMTKRSEKAGHPARSYGYNAWGGLTESVDGNGEKTRYTVDDWGRITTVMGPDGSEEAYTYNASGDITKTVDGNGGTISYEYNCFGEVRERTDQAGEKETFLSNALGQLWVYTDRNGSRTEYTYTIDGNISKERTCFADGSQPEERRYTYDAAGRLKMAEAEGFRYQYEYGPGGKLKRKTCCGRTLVEYTYNQEGQTASIQDETGQRTYYRYDVSGQLSEVTDAAGERIASYEYTLDGQVSQIRYGNGVVTEYGYDSDGNVTRLCTKTAKGDILGDFAYTYDGNGNRLSRSGKRLGLAEKEEDGLCLRPESIHYRYDRKNRLAEVDYNGRTERFTYDPAGNRLSRETEEGTEQYRYNQKNQLIWLKNQQGESRFTYDKQGSILKQTDAGGSTEYQYNAGNQVTKVTLPDGSFQENRYDAEGLRAEMAENGKQRRFVFHQGELLSETAEGKPVQRYLVGYGVLAGECGDNKQRFYYQQDEQLSTAWITDAEQKVTNLYQYDAFGNAAEEKAEYPNRILYTGQQRDALTGQYYLRARYYHPALGRFLQEDVYQGDGLNLYAYCGNNPVTYYDPSGYGKNDCPPGSMKETGDKTGENGSSKKNTGRARNNIKPDPEATGAHSVYKRDSNTGKVTNYKTYEPNPRNPSGFDEVLGYDGVGMPHTNKVTGEKLMPHVHDKSAPGGVRTPYPEEIPK